MGGAGAAGSERESSPAGAPTGLRDSWVRPAALSLLDSAGETANHEAGAQEDTAAGDKQTDI